MSIVLETVRIHWGAEMPDWIEVLARQCDLSSQADVARRLERSGGMISQVLRGKYAGSMERIEELVRGAYMDATVSCPAMGTMPVDECQNWRLKGRKFSTTNTRSVQMYHACRACPRNQKGGT